MQSHLVCIPNPVTNPEVILTVGEDGQDTQTAKVAWSADATTNKPIGMLPVKPGTTYTLKVPPQQEEVVMKFETFGECEFQRIDKFIPMHMSIPSHTALHV